MSKLIVSNIETQNISFDSDTPAITISSDGSVAGAGIERISTGAAASGTSNFDIALPTTAGKYSRLLWNIRGVRMSAAHGFGLRFRTQGGSVRNGDNSGSRTSGDYFNFRKEERFGAAETGEDNDGTNGIAVFYYNFPLTSDNAKLWNDYEFVISNNETATLSTRVRWLGTGGADQSGSKYFIWRQGHGGVTTAEINDSMNIVMFDYAQTTYTATMSHEGWELYGVLK